MGHRPLKVRVEGFDGTLELGVGVWMRLDAEEVAAGGLDEGLGALKEPGGGCEARSKGLEAPIG